MQMYYVYVYVCTNMYRQTATVVLCEACLAHNFAAAFRSQRSSF